MSSVYIPCLNVDAPDDGVEFSVGVVPQGGGEGGIVPVPGVTISHPDLPFTLTISPFGPIISVGINWQWWLDLFGLGETRIEREKEQIQDVYTPIFKYAKKGYGFPLHDDHALQFSSDYVKQMFKDDSFKALSAPGMYQAAYPLAQSVFVDESPSKGQRERIVNQFLANAHFNGWPQNAWIILWNGLLDSANPACKDDNGRWMRNPMIIENAAQYAYLLHYMPLGNFASAVAEHKFNDKQGRKIVQHWLQNPQLVAGIPQVQEIPPWAVPWKSKEDGGGQSGNPYETQQIADREPIQQLWQGLHFQKPWYPDLIYLSEKGLTDPYVVINPPEKPPDWDQQTPQVPWPGDNVLEIPPQPDGPVNWPQFPDCPPWNQQGQGNPNPNPQPNPDPEPQQPDGICDPDCQEQIDYLKSRVLYIDNWLTLGIVPRIENLETWNTDLEHRVPGPEPALPNPNPFPPWLPPPPTDPGDIDPGDEEPPEETPPLFDPECVDKLKELCDEEKLCEKVRACERELECVEIPFCDDTGGPWAKMAECWLPKHTNPVGDEWGVFAGKSYPESTGDALFNCFKANFSATFGGQGQGQGQGGQVDPLSEQGRYIAAANNAGDLFMSALKLGKMEPQPYPTDELQSAQFLFTDPADPLDQTIKMRQPKLREGETDPCAEEVI